MQISKEIAVVFGDNYALASTENSDFYYGESHIVDNRWSFKVEREGKLAYSLSGNEIEARTGSFLKGPKEFLIAGIMLFLTDLANNKKL